MTEAEKKNYFRKYHENSDFLNEGISFLEKEIRAKILLSKLEPNTNKVLKIDKEISILNRMQLGNLISWTESTIKRLLFEPGAFEIEQINQVINEKSLEGKWRLCFRQAFIKAFNLSAYSGSNPNYSGTQINSLSPINIDLVNKFNSVKSAISNELVPNIELRNKIQHGEWKNAFIKPSPSSGVIRIPCYNSALSAELNELNILVLKNKKNNLLALYKLVKDLATFKKYGQFKLDTSATPFEYFFNQNLDRINQNRRLANQIDYENYKLNLLKKYQMNPRLVQ